MNAYCDQSPVPVPIVPETTMNLDLPQPSLHLSKSVFIGG